MNTRRLRFTLKGTVNLNHFQKQYWFLYTKFHLNQLFLWHVIVVRIDANSE